MSCAPTGWALTTGSSAMPNVPHDLITTGDELFRQVLIDPASEKNSPSSLHIISGYADPEIVKKQAKQLDPKKLELIELIIGMVNGKTQSATERIKKDHIACGELAQESPSNLYGIKFVCRYAPLSRPIHSKIYVWTNNSRAFRAFCGSANYTNSGFAENREAMCEIMRPGSAKEYFDRMNDQAENSWDEAREK